MADSLPPQQRYAGDRRPLTVRARREVPGTLPKPGRATAQERGRPPQGAEVRPLRRAAQAVKRAADLWWLHPIVIVLLLAVIYLSVLSYNFVGTVPNIYVPSRLYAFGVVLILCLAVGAQWALSHQVQGPARVPPRISRACMLTLLVPTLVAYALWFGPLVAKPQLLAEIASGGRAEVRDSLSTIPGVTTFTQFGVAYVIAFALKAGAGHERISKVERIGFVLVFVLAIFRAFAWAERLAVLELLVCCGVARLAYLPLRTRRIWMVASVLPAIGPFALYGVFTTSEYFRSWDYYKHLYDSVWAFTLDRLITYYATAINNGIGMLTETPDWPFYSGAFSFDWAFIMPGLSKLLGGAVENPLTKYFYFLETYGRPEFNSPTAYFRLMLDFGYAGTIVYFLVIGYVTGRAYVGFRRGHTFGLLGYPVIVLFLVESLRYSYFGESRFVPLTVGLALLAWDMRRNRIAAGG